MEVIRSRRGGGGGGTREISSSSSPDRAKVFMQPKVKPIRKVQIVYYLTRNGHLEHPHYMEVTHLANHPLRLKDVIDRLIVLRGKGMPSLYSWSCKRSYKNGYVWNDLAENDVIHPADGAEFVLKGSELVENCSEKFQQLNVSSSYNLSSKRKPITPNLHKEPEKTTFEHHQEFDQDEEEEEDYEEELEEEKTSYTSSTTSHSRCSRGVSTDELEEQETQNKNLTDQPTTSSLLCREKPNQTSSNNNKSKRFDDDDVPVATNSAPSRNSVLLQLISCGNLAIAKAKNVPSFKQPAGKKSSVNGGLHRGVVCKSAVKVAEEDMITFMSENPRFGNFQSEEKEYFSGSIVESTNKDEIQPVLKKSNSYKEERSCKAGLGEAILEMEEEEKRSNLAVKGKCIPRKKSSSSKKIRK